MRNKLTLLIAGILLIAAVLPACKQAKKKKLNERVTLRRADKIPYGTYSAYENLKYIFPKAAIEINKTSPSHYNSFAAYHNYYNSSSEDKKGNASKTLYIIITPSFSPSDRELEAIMEFVANGNHVFISAFYWGNNFNDTMNVDEFREIGDYENDSMWVNVKNPVVTDSMDFTYPGLADDLHFSEYDSAYANILGHNKRGKINFIRHDYTGGGSIYMHANPLAFSNFFLLHKHNNEFYDNVFSYFPQDVGSIQWDEYFRYWGQGEGGDNFNDFQVILNNKALRFAFWLVIALFGLLYLFESKRKQRIIPKIAALRNTSLDFVKTIGRLYYQNRDNKNLATKMTAHLMDHIRRRYNIPTSVVDDKFISNLAYKSGYDLGALKNMFYHAKMIQDSPNISDGYLMEYNKLTEDFYKHQ